jgi:hypothetical protein
MANYRQSVARIFSILLLLACLAVLAAAPPGRPETVQAAASWSTPVNLSESDTASLYPDIAVDSAGRVYVVWGEYSQDSEGRPDLLMFRMGAGRTWSAANDVAVSGHLPQIAVDSRGRLHLLRIANGLQYCQAWAQDDPANARSWSLSRGLGFRDPYWPDMVIDSRDCIHVVFADTMQYDEERVLGDDLVCVSGCGGVFYTRSTDGGENWSSPVQLDTPEADAGPPRLSVGRQGQVYVTWADTTAGGTSLGISLAYSNDGGATWSEPRRVVSGNEGYEDPQVAVDSLGRIHVAWRYHQAVGPGNVGYSVSRDEGKTWSPVEVLPIFSGSAYSFGLAVDSADTVHMVLPLAAGGPQQGIYHLERPVGQPWSAPALVSLNPCSISSADVELVIGQGNRLHAVWYDRQECELGFAPPSGRGEIFYSTTTVAAPALPPQTLPPAPIATATARALPSPEPTATAMPSPSPRPGPAGAEAPGELPGWSPPVVGVIVAAGLVVLVVLGWSITRQPRRN